MTVAPLDRPPDALLAELDAASRAVAYLDERGLQVRFDRAAGGVRTWVEADGEALCELTPSELFALLDPR